MINSLCADTFLYTYSMICNNFLRETEMTKIGQNNSFHRHRKILKVGGGGGGESNRYNCARSTCKIFTTIFFEAMPFWCYFAARPLFDKSFQVVRG